MVSFTSFHPFLRVHIDGAHGFVVGERVNRLLSSLVVHMISANSTTVIILSGWEVVMNGNSLLLHFMIDLEGIRHGNYRSVVERLLSAHHSRVALLMINDWHG